MRLVSRFLSLKYKYTSLRGLCLFCVNKGRWTTYSINIGYKQGVKISRSKTQEITSENERKQGIKVATLEVENTSLTPLKGWLKSK